MRILVVSNGYPPHHVGGYELGCRDVTEELKRRGHTILVLTSTAGIGRPRVDGEVWRRFRINPIYHKRTALTRLSRPFRVFPLLAKERTNQAVFREALASFRPDLVYIWNPGGISMSVSILAAQAGVPVSYFVSDEWMARFPREELWFLLLEGALLPRGVRGAAEPALRSMARALGLAGDVRDVPFDNVQFASRYLMDGVLRSGKRPGRATVIHWGIDPDRFRYREHAPERPSRLLFVGTMVPHKGAHTAIEALKLVRDKHGHRDATLDLVGGHAYPGYPEQLQARVRELGLGDAVRFRGLVPREQLPALYHEYDVQIFPSVWPEPFSITLLEGMSSGLAVVGTDTGGSPEILQDGRNALVFPPEDAGVCAEQVSALLADRELYERIRSNGRRTIEERFRFSSMVNQIEESWK